MVAADAVMLVDHTTEKSEAFNTLTLYMVDDVAEEGALKVMLLMALKLELLLGDKDEGMSVVLFLKPAEFWNVMGETAVPAFEVRLTV